MQNCQSVDRNITFTNGWLNSTCSATNDSGYKYTNFFTNVDRFDYNYSNNTYGSFKICEYSTPTDTTGTGTNLRGQGTLDLNREKYYRFAYKNTNTLHYDLIFCSSSTDDLITKLNSVSSNDLYSNVDLMIPFLIFLVIFSFSYTVLSRVIRASARGDTDV